MDNNSIDLTKESVSQLRKRFEKLLDQELNDTIIDPEKLVDQELSNSNNMKLKSLNFELFPRLREQSINQNSLAQDIINQIVNNPIENISTEIELSVENKNSDTRNEKDMQELEKAIHLVSSAREILYRLLDKKLSEHSMSYYIREKGIGSKSIQELKNNRDKVQVSTLIHNLEKML